MVFGGGGRASAESFWPDPPEHKNLRRVLNKTTLPMYMSATKSKFIVGQPVIQKSPGVLVRTKVTVGTSSTTSAVGTSSTLVHVTEDSAWRARHSDLSQLPRACMPQAGRHGEHSYTLRSPSGLTRVEVLLRGKSFVVKSSERGNLTMSRRFPWGMSPSTVWIAICAEFGWQ